MWNYMPVIWSTHMCMHAYTYTHTYTHIYTYIYTLSVIKLNNFFFRKIMSSVALSTYPPFLPVTAGHNINQYPKYLLIFFIKLIVVGNWLLNIMLQLMQNFWYFVQQSLFCKIWFYHLSHEDLICVWCYDCEHWYLGKKVHKWWR